MSATTNQCKATVYYPGPGGERLSYQCTKRATSVDGCCWAHSAAWVEARKCAKAAGLDARTAAHRFLPAPAPSRVEAAEAAETPPQGGEASK